MDRRKGRSKDGRTDRQTLFYRTLSAEAGGPKSFTTEVVSFNTCDLFLLVLMYIQGQHLEQKSITHSTNLTWNHLQVKLR